MFNLDKLFMGIVGFFLVITVLLLINGCSSTMGVGGECECSCKTNCIEFDAIEAIDIN